MKITYRENAMGVGRGQFLRLLAFSAFLSLGANVMAANSFAHYKGVHGLPFAANGMQQVHEYEYYYYVSDENRTVSLNLPFFDWTTRGNNLEPRGYFRWFDYATDAASANLSAFDAENTLLANLEGKGLVAYDLFDNAWQKNIGVNYTLPADVDLSSWEGETVACDVSRYTDYNDLEVPPSDNQYTGEGQALYNSLPEAFSTFTHEPTLSMRYVFHILPASKLADDMMNTVCTDGKGKANRDVTYEDNKKVVVGLKDDKSKFNLRLNLNDVGHYYFHPMNESSFYAKHVFHPDGESKYDITLADFDVTKLLQPSGSQYVCWRIYSPDKTMYAEFSNNSGNSTTLARFLSLSMETLKGAGSYVQWYGLDGHDYDHQISQANYPTIGYGQTYYVVAYLRSGNSYCPVASYELQFSNSFPMTDEELNDATTGQPGRLASNITQRYVEAVSPINYDADNDQLDLSLPTTGANNLSSLPSKWSRRAYGFVYGNLLNRQTLTQSGTSYTRKDCDWYCPGYSPLHGEYGIYKTINLSGVSGPSNSQPLNNSLWWNDKELHDRTYVTTNGAQSGSFIYFDASDESRKVAATEFEASLCSGSQMLFSAYVADMTQQGKQIQPDVMFRLYGIDRDENGEISNRNLLINFSSGDFSTNRIKTTHDLGVWYQVFGRMVLPKSSGVENYTDFQLEVDNMCTGTDGADYALDDICLYRRSAIVDVVQSEALCANEQSVSNTNMKFKIRSLYATLQELVGDGDRRIYYRVYKEDGTPVAFDYDGDGKAEDYGVVTLPKEYDATKSTLFETDRYGDQYFIFANKLLGFEVGQNYFVSLATYDEATSGPGTWGNPSDVCSSYSNVFGVVRQEMAVTDATGTAVSTVRVSCTDSKMDTEITAELNTADPEWGGVVTLKGVKFDWYVVKGSDESQYANFQEALRRFRDAYPEATTLSSTASGNYTDTDYQLLKQYVYDETSNPKGKLVLAASSKLSGVKVFESGGDYMVYAIPVQDVITMGGVDYKICNDTPFPFKLRVVKNGPMLTLGYKNVSYPDDSRTVRMGLKQLDILKATGGVLHLPIRGITVSNTDTTLVKKDGDVQRMYMYVSDTNDPTVALDKTPTIGYVNNEQITKTTPLDVKFNGGSDAVIAYGDGSTAAMHEGYWYELNFEYEQHTKRTDDDGTELQCPGETFVKLVIVPEFLTWNSSSANNLNSNWNNDANWLRSSSAELYKEEAAYPDYGSTTDYTALAQNGYAPMRFSKVTVAEQQGKVYPDLGYIQYSTTNNIARTLTNGKGEAATENIQYDLMVTWDKSAKAGNHTDDGKDFSTEAFYGNTCSEIYFKPRAELREPCFLVYDKAYVEKELAPNKWSIISSPLNDTYAGELYVPVATGRQTTEAFEPITFDEDTYSRAGYPIYQRGWDEQGKQTLTDGTTADAYDYAGLAITPPTDLTADVAYWSHVYNDVSKNYGQAKGFAVKAGDEYHPASGASNAIIRLPKADASYAYYNAEGKSSAVSTFNVPSNRKGYELLVAKDATEGATSALTMKLNANEHDGNSYYLVGNPYPATLSMYWFFKANPQFERKVWTLVDGVLGSGAVADDETYNKAADVLVEPMQAFIVKLKDDETATNVNFTSRMNVDRWVTTTTPAAQSTVTLTVASSSSDAKSCAKVVMDDEASADYDGSADVETLHQSQLGNIPTVYTVASDRALAVNVQPEISWLPLGVVSDDDEAVRLSLAKSRYGRTLYLYDAKAKTYTQLDGEAEVEVQTNEHGRYFLTTTTASIDEASSADGGVRCYSPAQGQLTVAAMGDGLMQSASVFTLDSRLVAKADVAGDVAHTFRVAKGVYVVSVSLASTAEPITAKVNVR